MDVWKKIHHLARWVCVKCYKMKASVVYDWAVLPCDHLICIECFLKYSEELKTMFSCGCGAQFTQSAYEHLVTNCSSARDAAKHLK